MPDDLERARLILARQRQLGRPFDEAWDAALGALPELQGWGREAQRRRSALAAMQTTIEAWRAGYERKPPPPPPYSAREVARRLRAIIAA